MRFSQVALGAVALTITALSLPPRQAFAEAVGVVSAVELFAYGTPPNGEKGPKYPHSDVVQNEVLETVPNGGLSARFEDGTELRLSGESRLKVDNYVYNPEDRASQNAVYNLAVGTFYYATGKMKKEGITLNTPATTIGIRGTELVIRVKANGETSVGVVSGRAIVRSRSDSSDWTADPGSTIHVNAKGDVTGVSSGVEPTGDEQIDKSIPHDIAHVDPSATERRQEYEARREERDGQRANRTEGDTEGGDGEGDVAAFDNGENDREGDSQASSENDSEHGGESGDGGGGDGGDGGGGDGGDGGDGGGGDGGDGGGGDGGDGGDHGGGDGGDHGGGGDRGGRDGGDHGGRH